MAHSLASEQIRTLAREGARVRLQELRTEIAALESLMRDSGATSLARQPRRGGRRRQLSAAGRAAIAAGQKARWQKIRAADRDAGTSGDTPATAAAQTPRRRSKMLAAARKAVGERMRKYWAARRKQAAKKSTRVSAA